LDISQLITGYLTNVAVGEGIDNLSVKPEFVPDYHWGSCCSVVQLHIFTSLFPCCDVRSSLLPFVL